MANPFPTTTDDNGTGTTGSIMDATFWAQVKAFVSGAGTLTSEPFNAAHYADGLTVASGDVTANSYIVIANRFLIWNLVLINVTISGSPSMMTITLPGSFTALQLGWSQSANVGDGSGAITDAVVSSGGGTTVTVSRRGGVAFTDTATGSLNFWMLIVGTPA